MATSTPHGRLLVVDDEIELMRAVCESLREEGYETTGVTDPSAALDALRDGEFDLLLTDLMMPGTDGIHLLRQALEIDPQNRSASLYLKMAKNPPTIPPSSKPTQA